MTLGRAGIARTARYLAGLIGLPALLLAGLGGSAAAGSLPTAETGPYATTSFGASATALFPSNAASAGPAAGGLPSPAYRLQADDADRRGGSEAAHSALELEPADHDPSRRASLAPVITSLGPFTVEEGTTAVATLTATDGDTDAAELAWSIPSGSGGGTDGGRFALTSGGALSFGAAKDFENPDDADSDGSYAVTVQVSDGENNTTAGLTVTLSNKVELLSAITGPTSISYAENGAARVGGYSASSAADSSGVTWSLAGDDSGDFQIDAGVLRFKLPPSAPPDFESPADSGADNGYAVTVQAADASDNSLTLAVTVTVTDAEEPGEIAFSASRPAIGTALTASVSDPDAVTGSVVWKWERSQGRSKWTAISGATAASYTPTAADSEQYLRATATYSDRLGSGKTASAVAPYPPLSHRLSALAMSGSSRSMYPTFDPDVLHYAVECGVGDTMSLTWSAAEASTRVAVNGIRRAGQNGTLSLTGLDGHDDIEIRLSGAAGASTAYYVHCLWEDFPNVVTVKRTGATEELVGFVRRFLSGGKWYSHLMIIDNNGVPRYRLRIENRVNHFRTHVEGAPPYSYAARDLESNQSRALSFHHVILDAYLDETDRAWTVSPLKLTDHHDFALTPTGNFVLMSYESRKRDFGTLRDNQGNQLLDGDDNPYGVEQTRDSDIQIVTPGGKQVSYWSSWDHMAVEDCTQHRFPDGYAHINSLQYYDGDIVASFRGCSKVLRIDPGSGDTVWRVGRTYRTHAQWTASGEPAPLTVVGDPYGEFCGQHAARVLENGNLLLFDNGGVCVVNPVTGKSARVSSKFSRAVEYSIDTVNGEAIFRAHHSLHGQFAHFARSSGHVESMPNGDWLISWGTSLFDNDPKTGKPPDESATQVDPITGTEKYSITVTNPSNETEKLAIRAYPISPTRLAPDASALSAAFPASSQTSIFNLGANDTPKVVVAFSRPVVDFAATTPSVSVQGASIASVAALATAGEAANAYLFTLTPEGAGAITFRLIASKTCASGGICAADGSVLAKVPAALVIGPPVTVGFARSGYAVHEGGTANVAVTLSKAHRGVRGVVVPVAVGSEGTAAADDFTRPAASVTFRSGEQTRRLALAAAPDEVDEDDETVRLSLGTLPRGVSSGTITAVTVTIRDGPAPVRARGGGGGGGGGGGPRPSSADFAWTVDKDIDPLDPEQAYPTGLFLDGGTLWVVESGPGSGGGVFAYGIPDGGRQADRAPALDAANRDPRGVYADGSTLWVSDSGQNRLFAYGIPDGGRDRSKEFAFSVRNADARGIVADGKVMWVLDGGNAAVFAYRMGDGALLGEYSLAPANADPYGLHTDGVVIWVSDQADPRLFAYRLPAVAVDPAPGVAPVLTLARLPGEEFTGLKAAGNRAPRGIASDGVLMYVVDQAGNRIYTYNLPDRVDARLVALSLEGAVTDEFDPDRLFYRGMLTGDREFVTVAPKPAEGDAGVEIHPPDASEDTGHQVAATDPLELAITVTSPDGTRTRTYRFAIGGLGCSATPERCRESLAIRASIRVVENLYHDLAPGNPNLHHNISNLEVTLDGSALRADFLDFFNRTGGVERWGFPTSEVIEIEPGTLTQFFQRGVVDFHDVGAGWVTERRLAWDYVGGGLSGARDQGFEPAPRAGPAGAVQVGAFGHHVGNFDDQGRRTGFLDFFDRLGGIDAFGFPKTSARKDTGEPGQLLDPGSQPGFIRQYFQAAVFQLNERGAVELTLLGDTLRDLLVPGHAGEKAFARGSPLSDNDLLLPAVIAY